MKNYKSEYERNEEASASREYKNHKINFKKKRDSLQDKIYSHVVQAYTPDRIPEASNTFTKSLP